MYLSPQILGNTLCTLTKTRSAPLHYGVNTLGLTYPYINTFHVKYIPNDEMTKNRSSEFLGGEMKKRSLGKFAKLQQIANT